MSDTEQVREVIACGICGAANGPKAEAKVKTCGLCKGLSLLAAGRRMLWSEMREALPGIMSLIGRLP